MDAVQDLISAAVTEAKRLDQKALSAPDDHGQRLVREDAERWRRLAEAAKRDIKS